MSKLWVKLRQLDEKVKATEAVSRLKCLRGVREIASGLRPRNVQVVEAPTVTGRLPRAQERPRNVRYLKPSAQGGCFGAGAPRNVRPVGALQSLLPSGEKVRMRGNVVAMSPHPSPPQRGEGRRGNREGVPLITSAVFPLVPSDDIMPK